MDWLLWTGTGITILGVLALLYCVLDAKRAREAGLDDAALRARLQRLVVINMAALFGSAIGLMCVILGLFLR